MTTPENHPQYPLTPADIAHNTLPQGADAHPVTRYTAGWTEEQRAVAAELKGQYDAFLAHGFTDDQALDLTKSFLQMMVADHDE